MKTMVFLTFVMLSMVLGEEAPYAPSGTRPQGALLVLPTEYGTPNSNSPDPRNKEVSENLKKINDEIMEKLRQAEGSERGSYHVYLPNGRLQRVQYTSAPLNNNAQQNNNQNSNSYQAPPAVHYVSLEQLRERLTQAGQNNNQNSAQVNSGYLPAQETPNTDYLPGVPAPLKVVSVDELRAYLSQQQSEQKSNEKYSTENEKNKSPNFVASIEYSDVAPIPGPIYSHNPAPLTRVLRTA